MTLYKTMPCSTDGSKQTDTKGRVGRDGTSDTGPAQRGRSPGARRHLQDRADAPPVHLEEQARRAPNHATLADNVQVSLCSQLPQNQGLTPLTASAGTEAQQCHVVEEHRANLFTCINVEWALNPPPDVTKYSSLLVLLPK